MAITGSGTKSDPYLIETYADFNAVAKGRNIYWTYDTDRTFIKLTQDISGAGVDWDLSPPYINTGSSSYPVYRTGVFDVDMDGHVISDVVVRNGCLLPIPIMQGIVDYTNNMGMSATIIRNGTFNNVTYSALNRIDNRFVWLHNVNFINFSVYIADTWGISKTFMYRAFLDGCTITGRMYLQNDGAIVGSNSQQNFLEDCTLLHCDINFDMINAGEYTTTTAATKITLTHYAISHESTIGSAFGSYGVKTRFRGTVTGAGEFKEFIQGVSQYSVVDIDMSACEPVTTPVNVTIRPRYYTIANNVINTDNIPNGLTLSDGFTAVTSDQITDGDYLRQLDFPITNV